MAIDKIIPGDSQEELIKQAGCLIRVYESGRHIKQAASPVFSRKELEEHAPPKGYFLTHAITMGAGDWLGANRNADLFNEDQLLRHHGTFVTHGANYREHDNKPEKAIGQIKAAKYDTDRHRGEILFHTKIAQAEREFAKARAGEEQHGSMACFPGHTLVLMAGGTEKAIANICVGDRVVTHKGNIGTVSRFLQRDYDANGVSLRAWGLPEDILATAEHPVWTRPSVKGTHTCPVCGETHKQLMSHLWQKKDAQHQAAHRNFEKAAEGWKRADQLIPGDWVRTPFSRRVVAGGDPVYAALLGWYAAEGNIFNSEEYAPAHWCMDFTLSIHEESYAEEIVGLLRGLGVEERRISVYREPEKGRLRVRSRDVELLTRVAKDVGQGASRLAFSQEIMQWAPDLQKLIVEKLIEGDGTWHKQAKQLSISTVSRRMAWQVAEMLWRNDIPALLQAGHKGGSYSKRVRDKRTGANREVTGKRLPSYVVVIPPKHSEGMRVAKLDADYHHAGFSRSRSIGHLKHQAATAVSKPVKLRPPLTYIEGNFVYRRLRKIKTRYVRETVYDLTVPGDHGFVVHGVGVSNCSVDHDLCECCGFKSKTAAERCDHIRDTPGAWIPKFRKYAHMINIGPTFKDYSWVKRPADRIAHTLHYLMPLDKAASANRPLRGDELAELYGMTRNPWLPWLKKIAAFDAAKQEDPAKQAAVQAVFNRAFDGELDTECLEKMANHAYPARVMRSLVKRSMVLPLASFNAWVNGQSLQASLASPVVKEASQYLPAIRAKLAAALDQFDPESSSAFSSAVGQFEPMESGCGDLVDDFMDKAREQFSLRYEALSKRACYNPAKLCATAAGEPSPEAFGLGALYMAYLCKTASLMEDDWMVHGQLAALR